MKQKYSITVADMELNIISDASPDEVENIVGMLDRRMRDINQKRSGNSLRPDLLLRAYRNAGGL